MISYLTYFASFLVTLSTGALSHTQVVSCLCTDTFDRILSGLSVVSDKLFDISILLLFLTWYTINCGALTYTQLVSYLCGDTFDHTLSGLNVVSDKLFDISIFLLFPTSFTINWCTNSYSGGKLPLYGHI